MEHIYTIADFTEENAKYLQSRVEIWADQFNRHAEYIGLKDRAHVGKDIHKMPQVEWDYGYIYTLDPFGEKWEIKFGDNKYKVPKLKVVDKLYSLMDSMVGYKYSNKSKQKTKGESKMHICSMQKKMESLANNVNLDFKVGDFKGTQKSVILKIKKALDRKGIANEVVADGRCLEVTLDNNGVIIQTIASGGYGSNKSASYVVLGKDSDGHRNHVEAYSIKDIMDYLQDANGGKSEAKKSEALDDVPQEVKDFIDNDSDFQTLCKENNVDMSSITLLVGDPEYVLSIHECSDLDDMFDEMDKIVEYLRNEGLADSEIESFLNLDSSISTPDYGGVDYYEDDSVGKFNYLGLSGLVYPLESDTHCKALITSTRKYRAFINRCKKEMADDTLALNALEAIDTPSESRKKSETYSDFHLSDDDVKLVVNYVDVDDHGGSFSVDTPKDGQTYSLEEMKNMIKGMCDDCSGYADISREGSDILIIVNAPEMDENGEWADEYYDAMQVLCSVRVMSTSLESFVDYLDKYNEE